jgi:hypothetical protein
MYTIWLGGRQAVCSASAQIFPQFLLSPEISPMNDRNRFGAERFRVWIAVYGDWQPGHLRDIPPRATALEPAEPRTMTARQARRYVGAFNRVALARGKKVWAVALPVTVSYGGDTQPGAPLALADPPRSVDHLE